MAVTPVPPTTTVENEYSNPVSGMSRPDSDVYDDPVSEDDIIVAGYKPPEVVLYSV